MATLGSCLSGEPRELAFGTSGRRGLIRDLTPLEIFINVSAEMEYLLALPPEQGGIHRGDEFFLGRDLRPSSEAIARVIRQTILEQGLRPVNLGAIPTPALTFFALERQKASIMVTGSHIPFDRNGYKLNTSRGELLKEHEAPINAVVRTVRDRVYRQESAASPFLPDGSFRNPAPTLDAESKVAREVWVKRYVDFAGTSALARKRVLVYQHSAVGRDLLVDVLRALGADAVAVGRSEAFVPIDTENIGAAELEEIRRIYEVEGPAWAVVSTDGDSDRPLILAPDSASGELRFFSGDLVGMIVAQYLGADAVVVPVSCNDAIDSSQLAPVLEPKTRIGSPWVIAGMKDAVSSGKKLVCGWEANGGFLLGSEVMRDGHRLAPLLTRDAFLPIIAVLHESIRRGMPLADLFAQLPARYGRAGLLRNFPRTSGLRLIKNLETNLGRNFAMNNLVSQILEKVFPAENGFAEVVSIDYTDGARVRFSDGDIVHVRPSGNADELRVYTLSSSPGRAASLVDMSLAEPDGILRRLERIFC